MLVTLYTVHYKKKKKIKPTTLHCFLQQLFWQHSRENQLGLGRTLQGLSHQSLVK